MKILKLELENFMCFSGTDNRIEFTDGLNVILGGNGYGKTKLYDSFNWVLFDKITNQDGQLDTPTEEIKGGLVSKKAIADGDDGATIKAIVRLTLVNEKGKEIILERSYAVKKLSGMEATSLGKSKLIISAKDDLEFKPVSFSSQQDVDDYIREHVIQPTVLEHIWFQGERGIKGAVDTSNAVKLKQVINKLSYIDTWEKFIEATENTDRRTREKYEKAVKKSQKHKEKTDLLTSQIEKLDKELHAIEEKLTIKEKDLDIAEDEVDNLAMGENVREELRAHSAEEDRIKRELAQAEYDLDQMLDNANRDLFESFWVAHGTTKIQTKFEELVQEYEFNRVAVEKIKKKDKPKNTESLYLQDHIHDMLHKEHCTICDRTAPKDSDAYRNIQKWLPEEEKPLDDKLGTPFNHAFQFTDLRRSLSVISNYDDAFESNFEQQRSQFFRLKDKRRQLDEENRRIEEEKEKLLSKYNISSIDAGIRLGDRIRSYNEKTASLREEIVRLEERRKVLTEEKAEKDQALDKLHEGDIDPILRKQKEYFNDLLTATKTAKDQQYKKLVDLLMKETNRHYEAINKQSGAFYGKIVFKQNSKGGYSPEIHNENGDNVTPGMNTAQLLSMQFSILFAILSANKEYGFNKRYPLIADAPNSAFDAKKKKLLLRQIGTTFEQSIVMMFEYLTNDPERANRYKVDKSGIRELTDTLEGEGVPMNIYMLDIPDGVNSRDINELTVQIKKI
jgi:DNA sulfur modification protein DndD